MNPDRDLDRLLDAWFADGPREVADRVVLQVADRIERQSQRPAWRLPRRDSQVNLKMHWIAAAAVLVVAIFAGTRLLGPTPNSSVGGPSPAPTSSPKPTPTSTPAPSAVPGQSILHATEFGVPLTLSLVDGWVRDGNSAADLDLQRGMVDAAFHPIRMVTLPGPTLADPWIAVPADFVAWVRSRPEWVAGDPRSVTVGGRTGTQIDGEFVWKTGTTKREFLRFTGPTLPYGEIKTGAWNYDSLDAGARVRFIILPGTSGDGVIIVMNGADADFDAAAAALDAVLATVQFDPAP